MRDGATRSDIEPRFPDTVIMPGSDAPIVFLDLNHWIELAKASRRGGRYRHVLDAVREFARKGQAIFPLTTTTYIEIDQIRQHRQRSDLHAVIAELSGYRSMLGRAPLQRHEIETLLSDLLGPGRVVDSVPLLGPGVTWAFEGSVRRFRFYDAGGIDITASASPEEWRRLQEANLDLERSVLVGPDPQSVQALRRSGWRPEKTREIAVNRLEGVLEQAQILRDDAHWRRGRIRDVVAVREVLVELDPALIDALAARGLAFSDIASDVSGGRLFVDSLPTIDVAVSIKTEYYRDTRHRWTVNDIHDIDALATAVPYAEIVVTDKAAADMVQRAGLDDVYETTVLSDLSGLPDAIPQRRLS